MIWSGAQLGAGVIVHESVVGRDARLANGVSVLGGTIIGDRVTIEAGNKLDRGVKIWPNRRVPEQTIQF